MTQRLSSIEHWNSTHSRYASRQKRKPSWMRWKRWIPVPLRAVRRRLLMRHDTRQLVEVILRPLVQCRSGLKGLEIGSAPGYRSLGLWRALGIVPYGLEYSAEGVTVQRALYREAGLPEDLVVHGDFFDETVLAKWENYFDLVASYGFIEHFENPREVLFRHVDLLKPGGVLVVTVPNLNPGTLYGRLVRRFNPAVYTMHNIATCTLEHFQRLFVPLECEMVFCGTLGGFDVRFDPDERRISRAVARVFDLLSSGMNIFNHLLIGARLIAFPRVSPTLAAVAIKRTKENAP